MADFDKYRTMGAYHWKECDRNSSNYKSYNPPLVARYQVVLKRIERARRILDVGCGDGLLMSLVSPLCDETLGIEREGEAVEIAKGMLKDHANCTVIHSGCNALPFPDGHFDSVLMTDVIEHLEAPESCLAEIKRVIKNGGVLIITTPIMQPGRKLNVYHHREYSPGELQELLQRYFESVELSFFWPATWSRLYATKIGWRLIKIIFRRFHKYNPFLREGKDARKFRMILAVCRNPVRISKING